MAPPKRLRLLCFLLKNGSSKKTFGRAPLEEPEPEPERSPAKQVLGIEILVKIYPPTARVNGYVNIALFYSGFFASQK